MSQAQRVLSGLIKQLDTRLSSPSPPAELSVIVSELNKVKRALEADSPTAPSSDLLPACSLTWILLAKEFRGELAKVLKNVLAVVVVAVGELVVKARAAEDAPTAARPSRAQLGATHAEETYSQESGQGIDEAKDEVPSASRVASGWELVMLRLWEAIDMQEAEIFFRARDLRGVARDLRRDSVLVAMFNQFKHSATWIPLKIQIGSMLLNEIVDLSEDNDRVPLSTLSPAALSGVLATASHVSIAGIVLDLALKLCPVGCERAWAEELFPRAIFTRDAGALQLEYGDIVRNTHEERGWRPVPGDADSDVDSGEDDEMLRLMAHALGTAALHEMRFDLLKRALASDPTRAQSLDLAVLHAYPKGKSARAVSFDEIRVCPVCGESGHGPGRLDLNWAINKHSIEAVVVDPGHEIHPSRFDFSINLENVTQVELLTNSVTEELACEITTNRAPTLAGKPLKPARLGPAEDGAWSVNGDEGEAKFEKSEWVVVFVCKIDDGLIDLRPVFDDRAKRYPNLKRSALTPLAPSLPAGQAFLDYVDRLAPVPVDLDSEGEGFGSSRAGESAAPSPETSPESSAPAKRKAAHTNESIAKMSTKRRNTTPKPSTTFPYFTALPGPNQQVEEVLTEGFEWPN